MTLRMPLALQNQLKDLAEANTRTISGQALLYIKQGIAQDMQEKMVSLTNLQVLSREAFEGWKFSVGFNRMS